MSDTSAAVISAPPTLNQDLAALLKAAGDPLRLEILRVLARDSFGVMELSRIFQIKQSGMSHHLKVLANAGLVATRREGNSIFYRRALPHSSEHHGRLLLSLFTTIEHNPLSEIVVRGLAEIQEERAEASRLFFNENTGKFREQQDLIASYPAYADTVSELLRNTPLQQTHSALEIGPGEGEFLIQLAPKFDQVIALDNSLSMLDKAQQLIQQQHLNNIQFIHGDTKTALSQRIRVDCVVINMVLHHVPSPANIFADVSALLKPSGALLVTDLCHHDQQWAKEACGDVWLGFEPHDFSSWAQHAGLHEAQSQYIALRNGFQIQVRQFFKPQA